METTKIHLSKDELILIHNEEWILTKNRVIEKITHAMGHLGMRMQYKAGERKHQLTGQLLISNPKVTRGEKYQGLPYIILDYPRIFEKENILAIRTFFWWGNFCSITLHVKGTHREFISKKLLEEYSLLQKHPFFLSTAGDEWNHDLTTRDYHPLNTFTAPELETALLNTPFLKLSAKVELSQWEEMEAGLYTFYVLLLKLAET